jgi:hypothetical protein
MPPIPSLEKQMSIGLGISRSGGFVGANPLTQQHGRKVEPHRNLLHVSGGVAGKASKKKAKNCVVIQNDKEEGVVAALFYPEGLCPDSISILPIDGHRTGENINSKDLNNRVKAIVRAGAGNFDNTTMNTV